MTVPLPSALPEMTLPDIPYLKFGEGVTLTNCDREPIHIPGHAQAHGVVIVLDPQAPSLTILQVSDNLQRLCGISAEDVIGKEVAVLFGTAQIALLKDAVAHGTFEANPVHLFTGTVGAQGTFHVTAHTYAGMMIVELEPADDAGQAGWQPDPQALLHIALKHLRTQDTLESYCYAVCEAVQEISGFDRVMVYRFHEDGHGEVIGEAIGPADTREPYLGLHYPESDIPKQARALYLLNAIRLMPDALYEPSPLVPTLNPQTGKPLDMTHCVLRGFSRMYTEYLDNMGSCASMSLALVRNGALWGLIACHHQTFRWVPYDVRVACEFLADIVSLQIVGKMADENADYKERIWDIRQRLVLNMAGHESILEGLTEKAIAEMLVTPLLLLDSGGCAVLMENQCRLLGETPSEAEVHDLVRWLNDTRPPDEEVWATDALAAVYAPARLLQDKAAGLLTVRLTSVPPNGEWVLWFRPEVARTIGWGGNPVKPYEMEPLGDKMRPRKSFAVWLETVRERSLPWKTAEIEGTRQLRQGIVSQVVVRRAEELETANEELATLATTDSLTGLLNHRAFHARLALETARAQRNGKPLAVVMLDLDNFKFFNDAYGHITGDAVLCQIAARLRQVCRADDTIARFGGDEFALILPGVGQTSVADIRARLQSGLSGMTCRPSDEETIPIELSLGVALFTDASMDHHETLRQADQWLLQDKTGGGMETDAGLIRSQTGLSVSGFSMLDALVTAVDNKDRYTRRHSEDVLGFSLIIARELELDEESLWIIGVAALLHDVGKIGVPDYILRKPGKLTDEEFEAIKQHPMMGAIMVQVVPGLEDTLDAVRHHHERWDGGGYPLGLAGEEPPLIARLMAVADAYSAMTTDRPYRKGMESAKAQFILEAGAGTQWDSVCVNAFLKGLSRRHNTPYTA